MLNVMRKHAYSWGIRILLGLITVVFVFWGIGAGFFNQVHPVATVDGQKILADQVDRQADLMRRAFQRMYGPQAVELLKHINLREQALDQLIDQRLVAREARQMGLRVSNSELRNIIAADRAFQVDGQFNLRAYEAVLRDNNLSPPEFEDLRRTELTTKLLHDMVTGAVVVSDAQVRQVYNQRNERVAVAYIEIPSADFIPQVHPTQKQIEQYYKENAESFRQPTRVKVDYIYYDPIVLGQQFKPTDKEIQAFYKENLKRLFDHPEEVSARHILIAASQTEPAKDREAARAKAEKILEQLKHGADFAGLAKKYSDDPGTRDQGGNLGFFQRGQMIKPFEDAAFKLKPGQLSPVVETRFGYHIIRVDAIRPAHTDTLDEARPRIVKILKEREGRQAAIDAQREDLASALSGAKLADLAAKHSLKVVSTPMFAADEPIPKLDRNPDFTNTVFKLNKGEVGAVNGRESGLFLVKVVDRKPSYIPALKDIEAQVQDALVRHQAENLARNRAENLLKQIKNAADFNKVAETNHLTVHKTDPFDRSAGAVPTIGDFPEVTSAVGNIATIPGVVPKVMVQSSNYYIVELLSRQPPGAQEWQKAEPQFKQQLLESMRSQAWENFVAGLKRRARIAINADALGSGPTQPM